MSVRRISLILLLLFFLFLGWWRWEVISASLVSFATTLFVAPFGFESGATYFNPALFEFWIAGLVYVGILIVLGREVLRTLRANLDRRPLRVSVHFLATISAVAVIGPVVSPVPPNLQGNLITTRLLPPLSPGFVESSVPSKENSDEGWLQRKRNEANETLLTREMRVAGNVGDTNELPGGAQRIVFVFGSDDVGRDVLSRMIAGARVSLVISAVVAIGSIILAIGVGFLAGFSGAIIDSILMRVTDLFLAIPSLFLVIGVVAFLGHSIPTLILLLVLTGWMTAARAIRAEVRKLRHAEFVHAAKMLNQSSFRILIRHVLPNLKPILLAAILLQFGNTIMAEAALSFLGLGIQPPTASWGNMLGQSMSYLRTAWWLAFFPGLILSSVLIAVNHVFESTARD